MCFLKISKRVTLAEKITFQKVHFPNDSKAIKLFKSIPQMRKRFSTIISFVIDASQQRHLIRSSFDYALTVLIEYAQILNHVNLDRLMKPIFAKGTAHLFM